MQRPLERCDPHEGWIRLDKGVTTWRLLCGPSAVYLFKLTGGQDSPSCHFGISSYLHLQPWCSELPFRAWLAVYQPLLNTCVLHLCSGSPGAGKGGLQAYLQVPVHFLQLLHCQGVLRVFEATAVPPVRQDKDSGVKAPWMA